MEGRSAGFWIRLAAHAVDAGLFLIAFMVLLFIFGMLSALRLLSLDVLGFLTLLSLLLLWAGNGVYYVVMTKNGGQTLGKKLVGIQVTTLEGAPLSSTQAFLRWAGYHLSYLVFYLGYLITVFTPGKRALHDYMAKSKVSHVADCSQALKIALAMLGIIPALLPVYLATGSYFVYKESRWALVRAHENISRAELKTLRSALDMYYLEKARYPESLSTAPFLGETVRDIPLLRLKGHAPSREVEVGSFAGLGKAADPSQMKDTGHWAYDPAAGTVFVDCTHLDTKGSPVYSW